jgi:hypothetical protein
MRIPYAEIIALPSGKGSCDAEGCTGVERYAIYYEGGMLYHFCENHVSAEEARIAKAGHRPIPPEAFSAPRI